jgi:hypothetical protein
MALWKFSNLNKYGNWRHRIISWPDNKPFSHGPGFGKAVGARRFKYDFEHMYAPAIFVSPISKQKYIVPGWQKVHPDTQLSDINWVKPEPKKAEVPQEPQTWKFESSSDPGSFYIVRQVGLTFKCNCPGVWRSKDRKCKHIKEVEKCVK